MQGAVGFELHIELQIYSKIFFLIGQELTELRSRVCGPVFWPTLYIYRSDAKASLMTVVQLHAQKDCRIVSICLYS